MEIHQSGGLAETVFCCLWMVAGTRFELWKRPLKFEARHAEAASGVILRA